MEGLTTLQTCMIADMPLSFCLMCGLDLIKNLYLFPWEVKKKNWKLLLTKQRTNSFTCPYNIAILLAHKIAYQTTKNSEHKMKTWKWQSNILSSMQLNATKRVLQLVTRMKTNHQISFLKEKYHKQKSVTTTTLNCSKPSCVLMKRYLGLFLLEDLILFSPGNSHQVLFIQGYYQHDTDT